ncbi:B-cell receptor CD22-like [Gastrophryne carolinensis]
MEDLKAWYVHKSLGVRAYHFIGTANTLKFYLPRDIDALSGSCVVIPCKFTNSSAGPIRWFLNKTTEIYNKNSSLVNKSFQGRVTLEGNLAKGNCSVRINKVVPSDTGSYFPKISSEPPITTVSVKVQALPKKNIITIPGSMREGAIYTISCSTEHTCPDNPPNLRWRFRRSMSSPSSNMDLGDGRWKAFIESKFTPEANDNRKNLTCLSSYPNGQTREDVSNLRVAYAPRRVSINSSHESGNVTIGEAVNLTCLGSGNPSSTTVTWYKNNEIQQSSSTSRIFYIDQMTEDHAGQYVCEANNSIGNTASEPFWLLCICSSSSEESSQPFVVAVVTAVTVLLIVILAVVVVILHRSKVPRDTDLDLESPYTALQTHNRCPDYEQLQVTFKPLAYFYTY